MALCRTTSERTLPPSKAQSTALSELFDLKPALLGKQATYLEVYSDAKIQ
jgi:hypothetical protein